MHRIDADSHVSNMFDEGDPGVPRAPTQVDSTWLNAVQEEIVGVIEAAGIALEKNTNTQLLAGLRTLFVRTTDAVAQTITGVKSFTDKLIASHTAGGAGGGGLRMLVESALAEGGVNDFTAAIRNYGAGSGLDASGDRIGLRGGSAGDGSDANESGVTGTGDSGAYGVTARGETTNPARAGFRLVPQSPAPTTALAGDMYVNASDGKLYLYNGTSWVVVGTQS